MAKTTTSTSRTTALLDPMRIRALADDPGYGKLGRDGVDLLRALQLEHGHDWRKVVRWVMRWARPPAGMDVDTFTLLRRIRNAHMHVAAVRCAGLIPELREVTR